MNSATEAHHEELSAVAALAELIGVFRQRQPRRSRGLLEARGRPHAILAVDYRKKDCTCTVHITICRDYRDGLVLLLCFSF